MDIRTTARSGELGYAKGHIVETPSPVQQLFPLWQTQHRRHGVPNIAQDKFKYVPRSRNARVAEPRLVIRIPDIQGHYERARLELLLRQSVSVSCAPRGVSAFIKRQFPIQPFE